MTARVDTVPLLARPVFLLVSWLLALVLAASALALRLTCRVEYRGGSFEPARATIFCCWHDSFIPMGCGRAGRRFRGHVWMNHPAYYMKPVHLLLRWLGVDRVVLGSTGHQGQAAAKQLVEALRAGASTLVYVDGPAGPRHQVKPGALRMALESGAPLVAVRISTSAAWALPRTWDQKRVPWPFSRIVFEFSEPVLVTAEAELAAGEAVLARGL